MNTQTNNGAGITGAGQILIARTVLQALFGALKAAMVYETNNRAYRSRAEELQRALREYLDACGSLRIDYFNDFFFIDDVRLRYGDKDFSHDRDLSRLFDELQLGCLEFPDVLDSEELDRVVFALAHVDRRDADPFLRLQDVWEKLGLQRVTIRRIAPKVADRLTTPSEMAGTAPLPGRHAGRLFRRAGDLVREFMRPGVEITTANATAARRVVHDLIDHIVKDEATFFELAAIKEFDDYTYVHSVNVCIYSIALGLRLGLDRRRLSQLGFAVLFHDIGKTKLPAELICKVDVFNDVDWREIRKHPALGALTMAMMPASDEHNSRAVLVAYEHHLNLDGSGYPPLPGPRELNLFSRIVAITDSYDAMTSGRVYMKARLSPDEAVHRLLRQSGLRYDAVLLRAAIHALGIFPVGTFVRLNTGEEAMVRRNNPHDIFCPEVSVFRREAGNVIVDRTIHLDAGRTSAGRYQMFIVGIIEPDKLGLSPREVLGIELADISSAAEHPAEEFA